MLKLKVKSRFDVEERTEKLEQVAFQMHQILNSTMFRDLVLKMDKSGERSKWKDKSNAEIYNHIKSGSEILSPEPDNTLTWEVTDYYTFKKVIGYTIPSQDKIVRSNTKYYDFATNKEVGSNQIHEVGHLLGFSHDFWATDDRPFSICYQLNLIYEACYDRLIGENVPSLVKVYKGGRLWWKRYAWERK